MTTWEQIAAAKRAQTLSQIPKGWVEPNLIQNMNKDGYVSACGYLDTVLPEHEVSITNLTATELAGKIASREMTSYDVCYAFCHRAALAHQILNCCIEIFFEQALEKARELDSYFAATGKLLGPLHGVPFSLKDQVNLIGLETTIGYISRVGQKSDKMSLLAKVLQDQGAVFFLKTTVPTAMLASETVSSLHGRTLNAINIAFSSGGSSGGEGSLIGAKASPLGVGTDIGGSIRIPAAFQGLYGLRPSHGRIPYMDVTNSYEGQELIPSVIGPLSSSLKDLELFTKLVVDSETWNYDPQVVPVPWRDSSEVTKRKLRIGLMTWDGLVMPHPPVLRALRETCHALTSRGHEIVKWSFPDNEKLVDVGEKVYGADFYAEVEQILEKTGEPISDYMNIARNVSRGKGHSGNALDVNQWWEVSQEIRHLKQKFLKYWKNTENVTSDGKPIDAILCPVWPSAGFHDGKVDFGCENYTVPFNVLDYSCVVFPVTQVNVEIDSVESGHLPSLPDDQKMHGYYEAQDFDKIPVCLQVVCKRLEEEKVLAIASVIESCLAATT
ncbi:LANO_0D11100g1_1 [Lachancea nothofagi CBS 11611]|uniref:amidase n=1 Tax=Lachancea nothofagi CBS 11611 TaxID=1266666 RepID=A0A1G4JLF1_9SACH|nr:LANO_0D11100g1_1 [Lachancea nothofagi CBS 11611]